MKMFLAHPKSFTDEEIEAFAAEARTALEADWEPSDEDACQACRGTGGSVGSDNMDVDPCYSCNGAGYAMPEIELIPGRDDYQENARTSGGWRGWPRSVVQRRDYDTNERVYSAIIVPGQMIGKGTLAIVHAAFDAELPVVCLVNGKLHPATGVFCEDENDYQSGWRIDYAEVE